MRRDQTVGCGNQEAEHERLCRQQKPAKGDDTPAAEPIVVAKMTEQRPTSKKRAEKIRKLVQLAKDKLRQRQIVSEDRDHFISVSLKNGLYQIKCILETRKPNHNSTVAVLNRKAVRRIAATVARRLRARANGAGVAP